MKSLLTVPNGTNGDPQFQLIYHKTKQKIVLGRFRTIGNGLLWFGVCLVLFFALLKIYTQTWKHLAEFFLIIIIISVLKFCWCSKTLDGRLASQVLCFACIYQVSLGFPMVISDTVLIIVSGHYSEAGMDKTIFKSPQGQFFMQMFSSFYIPILFIVTLNQGSANYSHMLSPAHCLSL